VREEVDGRIDVGDVRVSEQELELGGVDVAAHREDLDRHLRGEGELVALEEAARRVDEDRVGDAVDEVVDTLAQLLGVLGAVDRLLEHDTERLQIATCTQHLSINQSINQSVSQSVIQSINQSLNQFIVIWQLEGWITHDADSSFQRSQAKAESAGETICPARFGHFRRQYIR